MRAEVLSEEMLTEIWSPAKYDPEWKIAYLKDLQERCKLSHNLIGKWLCGLRSLKRFDLKVLRELEDQLESTTLRNTLREVTHRARFYNSGVPLARFAIDIERSPNPINPDLYTAENISASRDLIESLECAIRLDLEQLTTHGRVGLLLVSAAYYGGLMDIPQLHAFLQLDPSSVSWVSEIPEIRLHLPIRGQPEAEQRQWFPDPTTLAFLSRCAADLIEIRG